MGRATGRHEQYMNDDRIVAHLNLHAVLQNLEELPKLDPQTAEMIRDWDISVQFIVSNGPAAWLEFKGGACTHGRGRHASPAVKLWFRSSAHLNAMFAGTAMPVPTRGFTRLGFLKNEFTQLTQRLEHFLRPENLAEDTAARRVNAALSLYTGAFAVPDLAALEATCKKVAAATPAGVLLIEALPDGPFIQLTSKDGMFTAAKGRAEKPTARMSFRSLEVASALLGGRLDAFQAVAQGDVSLYGMLPLIDNVNLIMDRVEKYLA